MAANTARSMSRAELEQKIVALAWKDEAFRKAFLADPKGQFEAKLGTKLPAGLTITAHAEDENHLHFVIPAKPAKAGELSDKDLEKVAGGAEIGVQDTLDAMRGSMGGTVGGAANITAKVFSDWV